jgi:hypothetical protein
MQHELGKLQPLGSPMRPVFVRSVAELCTPMLNGKVVHSHRKDKEDLSQLLSHRYGADF